MSSNPMLVPGVHELSRRAAKMRAAERRAAKKKELAEKKKELGDKKVEGEKDVKKSKSERKFRMISEKPRRVKPKKNARIPQKIRPSIKPGKVLIILSGRYAGKRVIALKTLPSGLILVNGPHKINGVPLRRVNQSNVIATSTLVDISSITSFNDIDDSYFSKSLRHYWSSNRCVKPRKNNEKTEKVEEKPAVVIDKDVAQRITRQKTLDKEFTKVIKQTPNLVKYLKSKFSLSKGQYPHLMKF